MRVLIIDNYDSFTYNLYQYFGELGADVSVVTNDELEVDAIVQRAPDRIVISPGPGSPEHPRDIGICLEVIRNLGANIPILGVCLGHQAIIHAFGGRIVRAPKIMHGKTSAIRHTGDGIFTGLPELPEVMRYHSLMGEAKSLPDCLKVTARTAEDDLIMGVAHRTWPLSGIQFHPESIGTPTGKQMLENFLR